MSESDLPTGSAWRPFEVSGSTMQNISVVLQRIQTIEQRIGLTPSAGGFSDHMAQALSSTETEVSDAEAVPEIPPSLMTVGSWLGLSGTAPVAGFVPPIDGDWGSGFGVRVDPFTHEHRMHNGIDMSSPEGTEIRATAGGTVTFAGERGGFGNLVIIDHGNGLETYYAHQSRLDVGVGDLVTAGAPIGAVGSTGRSTGPHLHFEVRLHGQPVDPQNYLSNGVSI